MRRLGIWFIIAVVLAPMSGNATTYEYQGAPLTNCSSAFGAACNPPHAGLTGSVTFGFDTSDFSGTIANMVRPGNPTGITEIELNGFSLFNFHRFTFNGGVITQWSLGGLTARFVRTAPTAICSSQLPAAAPPMAAPSCAPTTPTARPACGRPSISRLPFPAPSLALAFPVLH
jgi:hypothetical protein